MSITTMMLNSRDNIYYIFEIMPGQHCLPGRISICQYRLKLKNTIWREKNKFPKGKKNNNVSFETIDWRSCTGVLNCSKYGTINNKYLSSLYFLYKDKSFIAFQFFLFQTKPFKFIYIGIIRCNRI